MIFILNSFWSLDMDLYQLKTFFILAKEKNFTRAAALLFVTQSAVSHAIKKLETSLGTPLINRNKRTLSLTLAGQALFKSCEKIFYEIEKVDQDIDRHKKESKILIRLGSTVEFGATILIRHIPDFLKLHPDIHLDYYFSSALETPLARDEVDLTIDCLEYELSGLEKIHLFREQFVTIASPQFIKEHAVYSLDDLERVNILSDDKELDWWENFITAIPEEKRSCLKRVVRINHVRGIINAAVGGLGVGFVPRYTVIRELKERVLIDPFPTIKPNASHFHIFIKKEKMEFRKNKALIDFLTRLKPSEFGVG